MSDKYKRSIIINEETFDKWMSLGDRTLKDSFENVTIKQLNNFDTCRNFNVQYNEGRNNPLPKFKDDPNCPPPPDGSLPPAPPPPPTNPDNPPPPNDGQKYAASGTQTDAEPNYPPARPESNTSSTQTPFPRSVHTYSQTSTPASFEEGTQTESTPRMSSREIQTVKPLMMTGSVQTDVLPQSTQGTQTHRPNLQAHLNPSVNVPPVPPPTSTGLSLPPSRSQGHEIETQTDESPVSLPPRAQAQEMDTQTNTDFFPAPQTGKRLPLKYQGRISIRRPLHAPIKPTWQIRPSVRNVSTNMTRGETDDTSMLPLPNSPPQSPRPSAAAPRRSLPSPSSAAADDLYLDPKPGPSRKRQQDSDDDDYLRKQSRNQLDSSDEEMGDLPRLRRVQEYENDLHPQVDLPYSSDDEPTESLAIDYQRPSRSAGVIRHADMHHTRYSPYHTERKEGKKTHLVKNKHITFPPRQYRDDSPTRELRDLQQKVDGSSRLDPSVVPLPPPPPSDSSKVALPPSPPPSPPPDPSKVALPLSPPPSPPPQSSAQASKRAAENNGEEDDRKHDKRESTETVGDVRDRKQREKEEKKKKEKKARWLPYK